MTTIEAGSEARGSPGRMVALAVTLLGVAGLLVVGIGWVPWHPVPGGMPDPVPASAVFSAAQVDRAEAFARWSRVWSWSGLVVSLVAYVWLGRSALRGRLGVRLASPNGSGWWWRVLVAVVVVVVVVRLITLPFAIAAHVHLVHGGLSTQGWGGFAADLAKGLGVGAITSALAMLVLVGCARRWPRAWPAVAGGLLAALVLAGSFVYPVVVEPLFNRFTPLADGPIRTEVLRLADREGVPVRDVLVADASRRTTTLNAYVSGFGGTRRVVLYDTLVSDLPADQVASVVAHELAHARHDDVLVGSSLGAFGALAAVGLLGLIWPGERRGSRVGERRGSRVGVASAAAVPVVLAAVAVGSVALSPVQNAVSRAIETRADVDALGATGQAGPFVTMQRELALHALSDPTPPRWSQWWFGSHPTVLQRIAIAERVAPG